MKMAYKTIAFPVWLFMLVFVSQASADLLGDKIADQLCNGNSTTYTLSATELVQWSGQEVSGEKATFKSGDKYIATFYKPANKDNNATCRRKAIVSGVATCKLAGVTKSVNVLTRGSWGTVTCP